MVREQARVAGDGNCRHGRALIEAESERCSFQCLSAQAIVMFGTGSHQNDEERLGGIEGESGMFPFSSMQCGQRSPKVPEVSVGHRDGASTQPQDDEHPEIGTYLVLFGVEI